MIAGHAIADIQTGVGREFAWTFVLTDEGAESVYDPIDHVNWQCPRWFRRVSSATLLHDYMEAHFRH